jgi:twitching motility protein PilT
VKRIDFYVQHLVRHAATEVVIASGQPALFRFPSGEKRSSTPIDHAQITQLFTEAAPATAVDQLRKTGECSFAHSSDGGATVKVKARAIGAREWQITLTPADSRQSVRAAARPISIPPRAPSKSDTAVERPTVGVVGAVKNEPRIERMLRLMVARGASDLHLSTGVPPMVRLHGEMQVLEQRNPFTDEELSSLLSEIMPERNKEELARDNDTDFAHAIADVARFRANYFRDRNGVGAVFRQIPFDILSAEKLGIPPQVLELCYLTKGLVLVTGPTGSGKSTTLATLIDVVNQKRADHIITIEDPIEFVHKNKKCLVNQREVGTHTTSFKKALRAALREDPDIVLVGEMRDLETIAIAIETAETGHLVFGTLHTTTAPSTVDRLIDQFPADRQGQIRMMLSESLRGVVAQVLCKKKGGGRIAAYEILIANNAVSNLIREGKTFQIPSIMQTGKNIGMQTMNDHLFQHVKNGLVEPEEAYMKSVDKAGMREMLKRLNIELKL